MSSIKDLAIFPITSFERLDSNSSNNSLSNIDGDNDFVEMKENGEEFEKLLKEIALSKLLFDYDVGPLKR